MKPWKRLIVEPGVRVRDLLQWGHGDEAVEEAVIASSSAAQLIASMGPRR